MMIFNKSTIFCYCSTTISGARPSCIYNRKNNLWPRLFPNCFPLQFCCSKNISQSITCWVAAGVGISLMGRIKYNIHPLVCLMMGRTTLSSKYITKTNTKAELEVKVCLSLRHQFIIILHKHLVSRSSDKISDDLSRNPSCRHQAVCGVNSGIIISAADDPSFFTIGFHNHREGPR